LVGNEVVWSFITLKMRKIIRLFSIVFVKIALLESFGFYLVIPKAQAGGSDESIPSTTSPSLPAPNQNLPVLSVLNWDKWGTPYWLNNNICRENKGNIICLSPKVALKIRWKIP
jgi:hypothetical protein